MRLYETFEYKRAFEAYIRRGVPISLSLKMETEETAAQHTTTHYIWRTVGDAKVRVSHTENEGKIFSWDDPPETGHPGEAFNCRCHAEPYVKGESEFAYQELGKVSSKLIDKWDTYTFAQHFYLGGGTSVNLAKTGNLPDLINFYNYEIIRDGKNSVERLKAQIIDEARNHPSGKFTYDFDRSYTELQSFIYGFGGATISGRFAGSVRHENGIMFLEGNIDFLFDDTFTDPRNKRQNAIGTSDPRAVTPQMLADTEYGGTYYKITGKWSSKFRAEAKYDESSSRYIWH